MKVTLIGKVERIGVKGSAIVLVSYAVRHPRYQKVLRRTRKFMAENEVKAVVGDRVKILESRPLSKRKRFIVKEIIGKR